MNKRKIKKAIYRLSHLPSGVNFLKYAGNKIRSFQLRRAQSLEVAHPSTLMLELTNRCNLACTTCPRVFDFGKAMDQGNMPKHEAIKIIDDVWPYLDSIGLTGMGETFIYNDIAEIAKYIKNKNKGIVISVSTNAMLPDFLERVAKVVGIIDTIQISIDGLNEVYEQIRKNAKFETLDRNINALAKMCANTRTTLMLNMVVVKENYHQMPDVIKYAATTGVSYLDFSQFNLASVTNIDTSYYDFYKSAEFLAVISEVEKLQSTTKELSITFNFKEGNGFKDCPFPWSHYYVCWNGEMAPCCAKPFPKEKSFGNAFDSGLMTVLNNKQYHAFRSAWYGNKTIDFCKKCHFTSCNSKNSQPLL